MDLDDEELKATRELNKRNKTMLSDEEKEIFNNLKEYMQSKINKGYHKFIYNDLDWDFKCIDCINAIDNALKQSKEIEELKDEYNTKLLSNAGIYQLGFNDGKKSVEDKIKAKIEEIDKILERNLLVDRLRDYFDVQKEVLHSLLEKEGE